MKEMTCNESAYRSIQTLRKKAKEHQKLLLSSDQVSENYKNTVSDLTLVTPNPSKQPPGVSANKKIDFLTRDRIKSCDALNEVDEKVFEWYEVRQRPKSPSADARPNRKLQDRPVSVSRMTKNGRIIDKCILQSFEEISTDNKLKDFEKKLSSPQMNTRRDIIGVDRSFDMFDHYHQNFNRTNAPRSRTRYRHRNHAPQIEEINWGYELNREKNRYKGYNHGYRSSYHEMIEEPRLKVPGYQEPNKRHNKSSTRQTQRRTPSLIEIVDLTDLNSKHEFFNNVQGSEEQVNLQRSFSHEEIEEHKKKFMLSSSSNILEFKTSETQTISSGIDESVKNSEIIKRLEEQLSDLKTEIMRLNSVQLNLQKTLKERPVVFVEREMEKIETRQDSDDDVSDVSEVVNKEVQKITGEFYKKKVNEMKPKAPRVNEETNVYDQVGNAYSLKSGRSFSITTNSSGSINSSIIDPIKYFDKKPPVASHSSSSKDDPKRVQTNQKSQLSSEPAHNHLYLKLAELISKPDKTSHAWNNEMHNLLSTPEIKVELKQLHKQLSENPEKFLPKLQDILSKQTTTQETQNSSSSININTNNMNVYNVDKNFSDQNREQDVEVLRLKRLRDKMINLKTETDAKKY